MVTDTLVRIGIDVIVRGVRPPVLTGYSFLGFRAVSWKWPVSGLARIICYCFRKYRLCNVSLSKFLIIISSLGLRVMELQ